jgi:hypothetical protein
VETLGYVEPSYVIRQFLDARRIESLTTYLEAAHAHGLAAADHTTLLLNCYTKLQQTAKLEAFIAIREGEDAEAYSRRFDVPTALKVCCAAGLFEHALQVRQLDLLVLRLERCGPWSWTRVAHGVVLSHQGN